MANGEFSSDVDDDDWEPTPGDRTETIEDTTMTSAKKRAVSERSPSKKTRKSTEKGQEKAKKREDCTKEQWKFFGTVGQNRNLHALVLCTRCNVAGGLLGNGADETDRQKFSCIKANCRKQPRGIAMMDIMLRVKEKLDEAITEMSDQLKKGYMEKDFVAEVTEED